MRHNRAHSVSSTYCSELSGNNLKPRVKIQLQKCLWIAPIKLLKTRNPTVLGIGTISTHDQIQTCPLRLCCSAGTEQMSLGHRSQRSQSRHSQLICSSGFKCWRQHIFTIAFPSSMMAYQAVALSWNNECCSNSFWEDWDTDAWARGSGWPALLSDGPGFEADGC